MSRPEAIKDVKDRTIRVGSMDLERIVTVPAILKHYTALIEALQKIDGEIRTAYGMTVEFYLPRDEKQLLSQLSTDQYQWDDSEMEYRRALKADLNDSVKEYKRDRIKEWAKEEGLPDPFDVFAANDPELQRIREEMGLE